jgi:hypothetical protein
MVKETLVGLNIAGGEKILDMLDAAKFPVTVALWALYGPEGDERWRLILASPLHDKLGYQEAFLKMFHALSGSNHDWALSPIILETTRNPFIRNLRKEFGKASHATGLHLGGRTVGDRWVDDLYIYRIR